MPNCFNLTRKGEDKPIVLQELDRELCEALGVPVHETRWVHDWYNSIGFMLAMGWKDFPAIRKALTVPCVAAFDPRDCTKHAHDHTNSCRLEDEWCASHSAVWYVSRDRVSCSRRWDGYTADDPLLRVLDYLEEHFTPNAWAEIGRRRDA